MKCERDRSVLYALEPLQPRVMLSADVVEKCEPVDLIDTSPALDAEVVDITLLADDTGLVDAGDLMTTCFMVDGEGGDAIDFGEPLDTDVPVRTWFELNPLAGEEFEPEWVFRTLDGVESTEVEIPVDQGEVADGEILTLGEPEGELVDPLFGIDISENPDVIFYCGTGAGSDVVPVPEQATVEVESAGPQEEVVPAASEPAPQAAAPALPVAEVAAPNTLLVDRPELLSSKAGILE